MSGLEFQQKFITENSLLIKNFKKYKGEELCKYYPLSSNSLDALTNSYLYASRKDQMNDYRENAFLTNIENDIINNKLRKLHNMTSGRTGIISLSEESNQFPFFSYYTADKGFCIVFKSDIFNEEDVGIPLKVKYDKRPGKIIFELDELTDIFNVNIQDKYRKDALYTFLVKGKKWENEKEWRIIIDYDTTSINLTVI